MLPPVTLFILARLACEAAAGAAPVLRAGPRALLGAVLATVDVPSAAARATPAGAALTAVRAAAAVAAAAALLLHGGSSGGAMSACVRDLLPALAGGSVATFAVATALAEGVRRAAEALPSGAPAAEDNRRPFLALAAGLGAAGAAHAGAAAAHGGGGAAAAALGVMGAACVAAAALAASALLRAPAAAAAAA
jgi:hypothetical protein